MARLVVELDAPRVFAGDVARLRFLLRGDPPAGARVLLTCVARAGFRLGLTTAAHATGENRITERTIASHSLYLDHAGPTEIPWSFRIPEDIPPTHDAFGVAFSGVTVEAIFDLGDDRLEQTFPLTVDARPRDVAALPTTAASPTAVHRLELSVATARLGPGDTLAGLCAAIGMKDHRPRTVKLSVTGVLAIPQTHLSLFDHSEQPTEVRRSVIEHDVVLPSGIGDGAVPFAFVLPPFGPALAPSIDLPTHRMHWMLVGVTDQYFFEGPAQVELPLDIIAPGQATAAATPPAIGSPSVVEICERLAAERDWRVDPAIVTDADLGTIYPRLEIAGEPVRIWVGIAHRDGGIAMVAGFSYRPLELGLEVVRSSALRSLFSPRDLESGDDEWDRKHRVHARDADGAVAVLRAIVPLLARIGSVIRWTDSELVTERPISGGIEPEALAEVIKSAQTIGRAFAGLAQRTEGPYR